MSSNSKDPGIAAALIAEANRLEREKAEIEKRLSALYVAYDLVYTAYDQLEPKPRILTELADTTLGITDRIRKTLMAAWPDNLSPRQVRDVLVANGFKTEGRSNPLAEIHQILKRLAASEEANEIPYSDAKERCYRWSKRPPNHIDEPELKERILSILRNCYLAVTVQSLAASLGVRWLRLHSVEQGGKP